MIRLDGTPALANENELLIDVINSAAIALPQVCYHKQLGPIQTCDTCMVEAG